MKIGRRVFFSALLFVRPAQITSTRVAVIETFGEGDAPAAVLVHHSEPATRAAFAQWLQKNPRIKVKVRSQSGEEAAAKMFRVRMCFGRGLILLEKPVQVREGDLLTIEPD
jgi:hypothetical protein